MTAIIAASLLFVALVVNAFLWPTSRTHFAFYVSLFAFVSLLGKVPQVYEAVNQWASGSHGLELIIDLAFVACIWALDASIGVSAAGTYTASPIVRITCIGGGVLMLASFVFLSRPATQSASFNGAYHDQPLFLVYRLALAVVTAVGCAHAGYVVAHNFPSARLRRAYRLGAGVLALGLILGVIVGVGSGVLGVGLYLEDPSVVAVGTILNVPVRSVAAIFVAFGLALPPSRALVIEPTCAAPSASVATDTAACA